MAVGATGVLMFAVAAWVAACASTPPAPTASLEAARLAIANAEQVDASRYAGEELGEARIKLASAGSPDITGRAELPCEFRANGPGRNGAVLQRGGVVVKLDQARKTPGYAPYDQLDFTVPVLETCLLYTSIRAGIWR